MCSPDTTQPSSPLMSTPDQVSQTTENLDPVTGDGEFFTTVTDLSYPGFGIKFEFSRSYRSRSTAFGPLGHNWDHSYDRRLFGDTPGHAYCDGSIDYADGKLGGVHFTPLHNDVIRVVANEIVSPLVRITSALSFLPHTMIVRPPPPVTPVNPPPSITPVNPPPPITPVNPPPPGTPIVTPPANTHIDYATSDGSSLRLTYDSALPYPWTLHDPSGVVSSFDLDGNLVVMQHPAGPKMTFTWANKHLTQIVDTTGRTINLNYDAKGKFLTCLSKDTTCANPLVTYKVDGYDDLAAVSYGTTTEGSVQYVYHRGEHSSWYVGYEAADASCTSLCAARTTSPSQCRNEDVCHFNVCQTIGGADAVAGQKACMAYCRPGCLAQCARTPAGTAICPECGPAHLTPTCGNECTFSCGSFCADLTQAAASCMASLPSYCAATDCKSDCLKKLSSPLPEAPSQAYFIGHRDELNHNIEQIIDDQGRVALINRYGTDPNDESFDKIIDQQVGDLDEAESHGQFEYHDLKLEDQQLTAWSFSNQPSVPNASVVPLRSFVAKTICPQTCAPGAGINGCVSPTYAYGAAFDYSAVPVGGTSPVMQVPRYATVIRDLGGVVKTTYFDDHWRPLREVVAKDGQQEQTDYNYKNGFQIGRLNPAGDRVCTEMAGPVPWQITRLPAPGFAGSQEPIITRLTYDAAAQLTDAVTDPAGDNIRVHYERDAFERVKWVDKSIDANTTERTKYDYDNGMPSPRAMTSPGGSVTTYTSYDPVGAAPQLVSVGADGLAPIQTRSTFDSDGRIAETGKPNLSASHYQYAVTGRVTLSGKRYDANSPWRDATSSFGAQGLLPLTTVGVRVTTQRYTNPQGDTTWKSETPNDGSQPSRYTCYHYDGEGHLLETILPEGNSIVTTYDEAWRPVAVSQGKRGTEPAFAWARRCLGNTGDWTGAMETLSSATFAPGGWPQSKNSEGVTTTFVTDGFGRVLEERDALGGVRRHGFDRQGRVAWDAVLQPSASSTPYARPQPDITQVAQMTEYTYDHLGRALTVTRWHLEDKTTLVKRTQYLDPQRTVVETEAGLTTTTVFDGAGRVSSKTLPDGSTVSFGYAGDSGSIVTKTIQTNNPSKPTTVETTTLDGMGFTSSVVDDQNTQKHSEGHDIEGHLIWTVDLAGNAPTAFEYDGFGRLKTERRIFETVPPQQATRTTTAIYGYDNNDRRTAVTDGRNNTTTFQLDGVDRLSVRTDQLGRQTTFQYYTGTRRVWVQTDPSGTAFTRTYDPLGRASTETTAPGAGLDVGARQTTYGYDTVGRMNEVDYAGAGLQGWDNSVTMQFDSLGRKVHEANSLFGFGIDHTYDLGARWKTTSIAGATEQQSFDTLGRLSGVSLNGASLALYNYGASGVGGPLWIDYSTGAHTAFTYDTRNRQTDLAVQQNGATLLSLHTALGADGIPRERVHSFNGHTVTNAFQVDRFGRVTAESLDVANATPLTGDVTNDQVAPWMQAGARWRSYGLDATANWKSWNDSQTGADAPSLDARNAYTTFTGRQPVYDTADNAVSIPDATGDEAYTYDVYKHPLTATKNDRAVSYVYDGLGRRIAEQEATGTAFILWDGSQLAAYGLSRTDASNWVLEVGGADIDEHIASVNLGRGTVRIYHQTIDGSVLGVSDGTGLLEGYSYSAYGEVTFRNSDGTPRTASAIGNRFLYHGQLFDPYTRTYSMRAREYRPTWGRFLSTDPIGLDGGLNLYAFVGGAPLHMRDPMGTKKQKMSVDPTTLMSVDPSAAVNQSLAPPPDSTPGSSESKSAEVAKLVFFAIPGIGQIVGALMSMESSTAGNNLDERGIPSEGSSLSNDTRAAVNGATAVLLGAALSPLGGWVAKALGGEIGEATSSLIVSADESVGGAGGGRAGASLVNAQPVGSALKDDLYHRAATFMREEAASSGQSFDIVGKDGVTRTLWQVGGDLNGVAGRYEYIVDANGNLTHQLFVPGGTINGQPITP